MKVHLIDLQADTHQQLSDWLGQWGISGESHPIPKIQSIRSEVILLDGQTSIIERKLASFRKLEPHVAIFVLLNPYCGSLDALYQQGMTDYLSFPPVKMELLRRLQLVFPLMSNVHQDGQTLVARCCDFMMSNLKCETSLDCLSRMFGTNRNKLVQVFKSQYGQTPMQWWQCQKMQLAMTWLKQGKGSIGQVASELGFADANYFSTRFKQHFGVTPSQVYRR